MKSIIIVCEFNKSCLANVYRNNARFIMNIILDNNYGVN